jgi:hypothetical protein
VYGEVPPLSETVADPSEPPLHVTWLITQAVASNGAAGCVTVALEVAKELYASVTVT